MVAHSGRNTKLGPAKLTDMGPPCRDYAGRVLAQRVKRASIVGWLAARNMDHNVACALMKLKIAELPYYTIEKGIQKHREWNLVIEVLQCIYLLSPVHSTCKAPEDILLNMTLRNKFVKGIPGILEVLYGCLPL